MRTSGCGIVSTAIASVHYNPESYKNIWGARRFLSVIDSMTMSAPRPEEVGGAESNQHAGGTAYVGLSLACLKRKWLSFARSSGAISVKPIPFPTCG